MTTTDVPRSAGYSLIEIMFVMGLMATVAAISLPHVVAGIDDARARGAARYLAMRLQLARMTAVGRSTAVGVRFEPNGSGFQFRVYLDGNGNGIRTADVDRGIDLPLAAAECLPAQFPGVDFGVLPSLPAVDSSSSPPGTDPIKFGTSNIATFTPIGSASSGSVYVLGRSGAQYVVRVLGETARIRVLRFDARTGEWKPA